MLQILVSNEANGLNSGGPSVLELSAQLDFHKVMLERFPLFVAVALKLIDEVIAAIAGVTRFRDVIVCLLVLVLCALLIGREKSADIAYARHDRSTAGNILNVI
jgi:hypothetical protein